MDYFYDVLVNFQEENINYYEWLKTDNIQLIKKLPVILISREDFLNIYSHSIKIDKAFIDKIMDKTIINKDKYKNCLLMCDKSNTLILEFDSEGKEIKRSNLTYLDDEKVCDEVYGFKKTKLAYSLVNKITNNNNNRVLIQMKNSVLNILNNSLKQKDYSRIEYYYYEILDQKLTNIKKGFKQLIDYINNVNKAEEIIKIVNSFNIEIR